MNLKDATAYVTLSDGETWDTLSGVQVSFLTWEGEGEVSETGNIDAVDPINVLASVSLKELVECWLDKNRG
jgi:hypothetical protein